METNVSLQWSNIIDQIAQQNALLDAENVCGLNGHKFLGDANELNVMCEISLIITDKNETFSIH